MKIRQKIKLMEHFEYTNSTETLVLSEQDLKFLF